MLEEIWKFAINPYASTLSQKEILTVILKVVGVSVGDNRTG